MLKIAQQHAGYLLRSRVQPFPHSTQRQARSLSIQIKQKVSFLLHLHPHYPSFRRRLFFSFDPDLAKDSLDG